MKTAMTGGARAGDAAQPAPKTTLSDRFSRLFSESVPRGFLLTGITLAALVAGVLFEGAGNHTAMWACYALALLAGGVPSAISAIRQLVTERTVEVDLLMVVAALGAASVGQAEDGAILLFLFSLSNTLQDWAMGRTRRAIQSLMDLWPAGSTVRRPDGREEWLPLDQIAVGDTLVVRPGERFGADAVITEGYTSVDESAITGESIPVDRQPGEEVRSGTLNGQGAVSARVLRPAGESTLARLISVVEEARAAKSPTEAFAERLEGPYTIIVLLSMPAVYLASHFLFGLEPSQAWYRAMTFLVVASPCAVVISTPSAMLSAMAAAARAGTLFKSGAAIEALAHVRSVAFDKTGTLTTGQARLVAVLPLGGTDELEARRLAAGVEHYSQHPVARAVTAGYDGEPPEVANVRAVHGRGVIGELDGATLWAGTRAFASEQGAAITPDVEERLTALESEGNTTMLLGRDGSLLALLAVADTPRDDAVAAIAALRRQGIRTVMLTGDRQVVAQHIAAKLGVTEVHAELLPEEKLAVIGRIKREGRVAMVGDGVNDAPALAAADVGVSMGSGTDVALENADVVLMKNDLVRLAGAVQLARSAERTVRLNLTFALGIIVVVGAFALAGRVPLPLGVIAHEGGTVLVVLNGLRLLGHRLGH
ncbi:MAG TPA: heavy metal translocating P-type ATPase [Deinococcales bacterium]|nr:heavy metal translocating P-type ATPase [Deinococcales bacterium]